jgi:predicted RecB family endonuclease
LQAFAGSLEGKEAEETAAALFVIGGLELHAAEQLLVDQERALVGDAELVVDQTGRGNSRPSILT